MNQTIEEIKKLYDVENWKLNEKLETQTLTSDFTNTGGVRADYSYIGKLILNPVVDGRHRLVWLVLAPYAINILKLEENDAIEFITEYIKECDELKPTDAGYTISYYVSRAIMNGLLPPRLETLKLNDEELYYTIIKAINSSQ